VSWKDQLQVLDLDASDKIELTCRACGHLRYLTGSMLQSRANALRLTLAQVEDRARCRGRGCNSRMRLAMPHQGERQGLLAASPEPFRAASMRQFACSYSS
jgi:ribosomal protein L33